MTGLNDGEAMVEEITAGVPIRVLRYESLLELERQAGRRIWRTSRSSRCSEKEDPVADEFDWSITTFEGNRLRQHREFAALPFREKLLIVEQMGEVAELFARSRREQGLDTFLPNGARWTGSDLGPLT